MDSSNLDTRSKPELLSHKDDTSSPLSPSLQQARESNQQDQREIPINFKPRLKSSNFYSMFDYLRTDSHTFERRRQEAIKIRNKYQGRVPVIVERDPRSTHAPQIQQKKFLISNELTVTHLLMQIRKQINLRKEDALYLFVDNSLLIGSKLMSEVDQEFCCDDGFVYAVYAQESTFG